MVMQFFTLYVEVFGTDSDICSPFVNRFSSSIIAQTVVKHIAYNVSEYDKTVYCPKIQMTQRNKISAQKRDNWTFNDYQRENQKILICRK